MSGATETVATLKAEIAQLQQRIRELEIEAASSSAGRSAYQDSAELEQRVAEYTAELRASEAKNRALLQALPDMLFIQKRDSTYIDYRAPSGATYVPPEAFLGKTTAEIFPPELAQAFLQGIEQALAGNPYVLEYALPPGGFFEARITAIDADTVLTLVRDTTERKQTEEALRMAQLSLDYSIDGVQWLDRHAQHMYVNEAMCRQLGYTREELLALSVADIDPAFPMEAWDNVWNEVKEQGFVKLETHHRRKDGTLIPVEITSNYLAFNDKEFLCAFVRDITERKQAEKELYEQQALLQGILDNAPFGLFAVDRDGRYVMCSRVAAANISLTPEQVVGKTDYQILPQAVADANAEKFQRILDTGNFQEHEFVLEQANEPPQVFLHNWFPISDPNGQRYAVCGIISNITERKQAEAERANFQEQIIEAQRHALQELSTPLIPISDDVVIMPLVGSIDSRRAQQVLEALLEGVAHYQADTVILDITGVRVVDTQVANAFLRAAQAVQLLGARVILTGIQPEIAQTIVQLGADMSGIATHGSLQSGIATVLDQHK
ncbi:MAG: PAS domain S-box protein [Chloroflexaceae bacterium]